MTACGHLSQTLDGLDGARKENGGRGMEEPRASIPLDYRFLHLSFFFMLFSGLHIMIVKRKRMENRKYLVARSPFVK